MGDSSVNQRQVVVVVAADDDEQLPPNITGTPTADPSISLEFINSTPKTPFSGMAMAMKKGIGSMQLVEEDHITTTTNVINQQAADAWLPITQSRNGNAYSASFHTLSSGIGFQALLLPLAFTTLGWAWGMICLTIGFAWQLYTLWILIQLHESLPPGAGTVRYSRYLHLVIAAFGEKLGKALALFPTMYLSGGTCVALIVLGGGSIRLFFQTLLNVNNLSLSLTHCYLLFTFSALVLALLLPNFNSVAPVSLVAAITAVSYCTLIWLVSVLNGNHHPPPPPHKIEVMSDVARVCKVLNALGIIAFAFRGHNLVLEIQGTMPSSPKNPSRLPMWRGVKFSYLIIAICLFSLAIGGYWGYGNQIPNGGMLNALYKYHEEERWWKVVVGVTSMLVVINSLTSFQIYAMPVFDNLEFRYTTTTNSPCPRWLRTAFRVLFGGLAFFIAVALPFLQSLAGLLGGISLPVTLAYPCFMWIIVKKPNTYTSMWYLNWLLGCLGIILSVVLVFGAIWTIVSLGFEFHFFKPHWEMMDAN